MDIAHQIYITPPFTKYYLTMLIVTTFLINHIKVLPTYFYFAFSIKKIVHEFQLWRFFTNLLIGGKFNISFGFILYNLFSKLSNDERKARSNKEFSSFIAGILFLIFIIASFQFLLFYCFNYKESRSFIDELMYAFFAISSYREPDLQTRAFLVIPIKNIYSPFAMVGFSLVTGQSIIRSIVGIIAGYLYVALNDKMIEMKGFSLICMPKYIREKLFKERKNEKVEQKEKKKKEEEEFHPIAPNDQTNVVYRERGSVVEGNEFNATRVEAQGPRWE